MSLLNKHFLTGLKNKRQNYRFLTGAFIISIALNI